MSFLSHIGATAYKYEIELVLVNLRMSALATAPIWVEWKRGSSQVKSQIVSGDKGTYDFGKKVMKITSTMYKKKDKFQKKESRLTVKQKDPKAAGKESVLGYIDFDLASYVKTSDQSESMTLNLQKCSDKMARLTFRLNTHWMKGAEITAEDEMSRSTNFSTLGDGSQENSLNDSPASSKEVNDLDALEDDEEDDRAPPAKSSTKTSASAAAAKKGGARQQVSDDDDEEEEEEEEDEPAPLPKKGGGKQQQKVEQVEDDEEEESDSDAEARRKVKFSKSKLGRTSRESSIDATPQPPKKSALKGGSASASPPVPAVPASKAAAATTKSSGKQPASSPTSGPEEFDQGSDEHGEDEEEDEGITFFGVTLSQIMSAQKESFPDLDIPVILDVLLRGIEKTGGFNQEGIFRVSPLNKARDELRASFERGEYTVPKDPTVSAAVLKYWFAELKEPLFPEKLLAKVLEVGKLSAGSAQDDDEDESDNSDGEYSKKSSRRGGSSKKANGSTGANAEIVEGLKSVLTKLPSLNLKVLSKLCTFLQKVIAAEKKNKMSSKALAVVFAPNLIRVPMGDMTKRGAAESVAQDTKRAVAFVEHLLNNTSAVEQVAKGGSTSPAASTSTNSKSKPAPPPESEEEEEDEEPSQAEHDDDDPIPSFAHSIDLGSLEDELEDLPPSKPAAAAGGKKGGGKTEEPSPSTSTKKAPSSSPTSSKQPTMIQGRRGPRPAPEDSDDDSDEEDKKRQALFKQKGLPDPSPTNGGSGLPMSLKDQLFAKKGASAPTAAATTGAGKKDPSPSPASSVVSPKATAAAATTAKKPTPSPASKKPASDDEDEEDEEEEEEDEKPTPPPSKKPTPPSNSSTSPPAVQKKPSIPVRKPASDASDEDTPDTASPPASQSLKDQLFAKKNGSTAKKPSPKDDTDTENSEEDTAEKPVPADLKSQLFAKKGASATTAAGKKEPSLEPVKKPEAKKPSPKAQSSKSAFGEESEEEEHSHSEAEDHGHTDAHGFSVEVSEEDDPSPPTKRGSKPPPPPVPSPSPRSAVAALSAAAAAKSKSTAKDQTSPTNKSSPSSADELSSLRAQLEKLTKEHTSLQAHLEELESELEHAGDPAAIQTLEKDVKRLKSENAELTKTLESTSSGGSTSKQVDSLKKQVTSLIQEKEDLTADYDELETKYNELRKASQESKKQLKASQSEIEELKSQVTEAREAAASAASSSSSKSKSLQPNGSSSSSSLDEQQLREEHALLQLQLEEIRTELTEKLDHQTKLSKSLQQQLSTAKIETDMLRGREVKLEALNVIPSHLDPKKNAKDKLQMDLITAFQESQKRVAFLTVQLKECDLTLLHAKTGWAMTVQVLQDQIATNEVELTDLKAHNAELIKNLPYDQQQYELLQKKLKKSEQTKQKMTELLASMESEMNKKKVELKTALQSILDLQKDNSLLKEELVRSGLALKTIAEDNFELKSFMRMDAAKGKK